jgi:IS5 family transposase
MKSTTLDSSQTQFLAPTLRELCNPKEPLYPLSETIDWTEIEAELSPLYADFGRPAKPIRLMVGLHLLKHMYNLGDETVVKTWVRDPYFQFFTGEIHFQWKFPVEPSDMVHFRKRIGEAGMERILAATIKVHGKKAAEAEVIVDTTVQEKNISYPTDVKLYSRIMEHCWRIADKEKVRLRQRYSRVRKHYLYLQRFRKSKTRYKEALKAERRLKVLAGRLVRELLRKLPGRKLAHYAERFDIFQQVLHQKRSDPDKIYSIHEPDVYCIAKGKEAKKYEFGCKVSRVVTKTNGICVGALSFEKNLYDGHTLPKALEQTERLTEQRPEIALVDLGYQGVEKVGTTQILRAGRMGNRLKGSAYYRMRKKLARRSAIEPDIGHMKARFRLGRTYLAGLLGDSLNVILAGAAWNLVKWMNWVLSCLIRTWLDKARRRIRVLVEAFSPSIFEGFKFQGAF